MHGVATFSGLALYKVGTGYTLNVVAAGLTGTSVGAFDVTSGGVSATPQVTGLQVAGSSWSSTYLAALTAAGDGNGLGYAIPVGSAAQSASLPWSNLNQIQITFNEDVNVSPASLALTGVNVANYSITGFSYNSVTHTGTWTVAGSIGTDRLHIRFEILGRLRCHRCARYRSRRRMGRWQQELSFGQRHCGRRFQLSFQRLARRCNAKRHRQRIGYQPGGQQLAAFRPGDGRHQRR